jgi:putative protein-disulfide isomerase
MKKFTIIYDTYCGWCYGGARVLEALVERAPEAQVYHSYLFKGPNSHKMSQGFGAQAEQFDARIGQLTGQEFSRAYVQNVLQGADEVLESGLTAQAAVLVQSQGGVAELDLARQLQKARYVDGMSAQNTAHVAQALKNAGVSDDDIAKLGTPDLAARALERSRQADVILREAQANGVPCLLMRDNEGLHQINVGAFYQDPSAVEQLLA